MESSHRKLDRRALTLLPLVLTIFCLVSGGPHGLEEGVMVAGSGIGLLLIIALPLFWAYPIAMMTAELTAAIPAEGGYYAWTKRALGPFWGFQCAWWTWLYSIADAATYPVLFASYLSTFLKLNFNNTALEGHPVLRWLVSLGIVIVFSLMNVRGTKLVGRTAVFLGFFLILPYIVMAVVGAVRAVREPGAIPFSFLPPEGSVAGAVAAGMYIVMWNYLGWDSLSTVAEEVDSPKRNFPKALFICVPVITAVYLVPVLVGLRFSPDTSQWSDGTWPIIAQDVGGHWLGVWVSLAGLVSPIALFVTALLAASRIPFVLAEDRFFPKPLVEIHPKFRTPWVAILFCGVVYAILAYFFTFLQLIELNVTLYSVALLVELCALVKLRRAESGLERPYRIPGDLAGVIAVAVLPLLVIAVASVASIQEDGIMDQAPALALIATGPLFYGVIKRFRRA